MSDRVQEWTDTDNMCRKAGLTEARKKGRCRGPDGIDRRAHVGAGPLMIGLPIRYRFVQIKNRLVMPETDLIKQRYVTSKLFSDKDLVVSPHRNDEVGSLNQFLGLLPWDVCGGIRALRSQSGMDPVMDRLKLDVDPGELTTQDVFVPSLILSAYSAVMLRKMFPVHKIGRAHV